MKLIDNRNSLLSNNAPAVSIAIVAVIVAGTWGLLREAIDMALDAAPRGADLVRMDDRKGVIVARGKGLRVTGTVGVLDLAAQRGLVNFAQAANLLRRTNFRIPGELFDSLTKKHAQQGPDV